MLEKKAIRTRLLEARKRLSPEEAATKSAAIRQRVACLPEFQAASAVLTYVASKDNEVDTRPLIDELLRARRPVLVPLTRGKGQMVWSRLEHMTDLARGTFGILEPRPERQHDMPPPPDSAVLVPGIAFTLTGWRIGYGGGYFDRFLAEFPGVKIALAYDMQIVPEVPVAPHDVPMDILVTETAIYRCAP